MKKTAQIYSNRKIFVMELQEELAKQSSEPMSLRQEIIEQRQKERY